MCYCSCVMFFLLITGVFKLVLPNCFNLPYCFIANVLSMPWFSTSKICYLKINIFVVHEFCDTIYSKVNWIGRFGILESSCQTNTIRYFGSFELKLLWSYQPTLRKCCPIDIRHFWEKTAILTFLKKSKYSCSTTN